MRLGSPGVALQTFADGGECICEYTAGLVQAACDRPGVRQPMGRPGSVLDNPVIESWHSTLEFELRRMEHFATKAEGRAKVACGCRQPCHVV